jgi:hypothetical protein
MVINLGPPTEQNCNEGIREHVRHAMDSLETIAKRGWVLEEKTVIAIQTLEQLMREIE